MSAANDNILHAVVGRPRPARVRNCAACAPAAWCRQRADPWGPSAMACRRATRDECFRARGSLPLRKCERCGVETYMPYCHGCGAAANTRICKTE